MLDRSGPMGTLAVAVSAIGFGLTPFFATRTFDAGIDPGSASFVRVVLLLIVLLPVAPQLRGWRREALIVGAGGAVSMLGFAGFFIALAHAPVAPVTVVYYSYPIVVVVFSAALHHRRIHVWEVALAGVLLLGVIVAVGPIGLTGSMLIALAPACAAPVGWGIYLLVLSGPTAAMPTLPKMLAGSIGGVAALSPLVLWRTGTHVMPLNGAAIGAISVLTLCTLAIPAVLVTWGAPRAGDRTTAMVGSIEFGIAIGVGWLLMGARLEFGQLVGICLVLGAALAAALRQFRVERPQISGVTSTANRLVPPLRFPVRTRRVAQQNESLSEASCSPALQ